MQTIVLTVAETQQMNDLARQMISLSAEELEAAHRAWKQAAATWRRNPDCDGARRLYMEHMALERAVQQQLDLSRAWQAFAFQQAFGDVFGSVVERW